MAAVEFTIPLALAACGATLATIGFVLVILSARRRERDFERELDGLHDEIWELREASSARDRAEAANEAKSRFLASVSHEVRTPLNGILGMAELLVGTSLSAEQQTYLAAIRSSGSALASLIDEILDFSKIEAGKVELATESFDVVALVEGVTELLAPAAQGKSIEIASMIAQDVPRRVIGDPVRLRQILLNIAGNAVKFTETGGVGLKVSRPDPTTPHLCFEISDTGPGVPAERRSAIFEDFEQADDSTTRLHGGTGLGLAISKRLTERMGGSLALASVSNDNGATFVVLLPLPAENDDGYDDVLLGTRRVLIVADSPFEATFLATSLTAAGAQVSHVHTRDEALDALAARHAFDLVVVDCALGEDVTRELGDAAQAAGIKRALVLFSPFERRAFARASTRGFDGWLVKPVRRKSLFELLAQDPLTTNPTTEDLTNFAQPMASGKTQSATAARINVLLAEDNEINAMLATRHLQRLGANVTHAPDGLVALALAETAFDAGAPYDAMVLDIRMPGLDGLELARRIRLAENARGVPPSRLIALSADLADAERRSAAFAGIDECLGKPISFARLEHALGHIPERRTA